LPKEIVAISPRNIIFREYDEKALEPHQIRIKSCLSAEKHGTTLAIYRGLSSASFPLRLGNMTVGVVTDVGNAVKRFKVGDRVYGYLPIRETHTVSEDRVHLAPDELSDEELVCIDPAVVALMAVREGNVKLGEKVAIFGLGAIGLMTVQMAKISGSILVIGVEPIKKRRMLAERYGADILFDPMECDVVSDIREVTDKKGVDISIETSSSYRALDQAIRATRYGGTIVPVSWYHGEAKGLNLGEEWHYNRQVMISGARVESEPYRDYPRWNRKRVYETVIQLFRQKRINVDGMLDPIVRFEDVIEAYRMIDEEPEKTVKLGVKYSER